MGSAPFYITFGEHMKNPLIGITTYQGKNEKGLPIIALLRAYVDSIVTAGGIPVLLPSTIPNKRVGSLYNRLDGILFSGGGDIAFGKSNSANHPRITGEDSDRDSIELLLMELLKEDSKPFLGICRGIQVITVGTGGSLYTHIQDQFPGALKHDYYPDYPRTLLSHSVRIEKGSHLENILDLEEMHVNSLHHQGVKDISSTLKPAAYSPDGLVEALELPDHPFGIGVQWHPEWMKDQPATRRLFNAFIKAAEDQA
jgi:putative glutamine amidotransferase